MTHCVVITEQLSENLAKALGPLLEKHPDFPHKTNVQFDHFDRLTNSANIEIWERGSGYTLGSGSSSCALAFTYGHVYGLDTYTLSLKMPEGGFSEEEETFLSTLAIPVRLSPYVLRVETAVVSAVTYGRFH